VKLGALLLCALVVVGCGEKKGRYAKFDDDVTAKSWEVWRDPSRSPIYLRNLSGIATYSHGGLVTFPRGPTCEGDRPTLRIAGSTLAAGGPSSRIESARYGSLSALWKDLEARALVSRVEVEEALRNGVARAKPDWVKEFERSCPRGAD
jgi:hypothetical protein